MKRGTLSASVVRDVVVISSGTALSQILRLQAGFSRRGLEREGVQIGGGLAVFDTVDDCAQCQSPDLRQGFLPRRSAAHSGQIEHRSDPASFSFLLELDIESHH